MGLNSRRPSSTSGHALVELGNEHQCNRHAGLGRKALGHSASILASSNLPIGKCVVGGCLKCRPVDALIEMIGSTETATFRKKKGSAPHGGKLRSESADQGHCRRLTGFFTFAAAGEVFSELLAALFAVVSHEAGGSRQFGCCVAAFWLR